MKVGFYLGEGVIFLFLNAVSHLNMYEVKFIGNVTNDEMVPAAKIAVGRK